MLLASERSARSQTEDSLNRVAGGDLAPLGPISSRARSTLPRSTPETGCYPRRSAHALKRGLCVCDRPGRCTSPLRAITAQHRVDEACGRR
jgi:hypothetical protein